ncbi:hypothetical protein [Falsirhodobacter sp. 1013]|uniref:hypothetical protein n=1 Tax=Falsirhodobacter sp. 1013 TaxID=3417566 RepID=UPI003EBE6052
MTDFPHDQDGIDPAIRARSVAMRPQQEAYREAGLSGERHPTPTGVDDIAGATVKQGCAIIDTSSAAVDELAAREAKVHGNRKVADTLRSLAAERDAARIATEHANKIWAIAYMKAISQALINGKVAP